MTALLDSLSELLTQSRDSLLLGAIILFFGALGAASTVRQYMRLRHIKGPPTTGFSKWWLISRV